MINYLKMLNNGWRLYKLDPPSTNSYKSCLIIDEYENIDHADWVPFDNYTKGIFRYHIDRNDACSAGKRENFEDFNNRIVMWKNIREFKEEKIDE